MTPTLKACPFCGTEGAIHTRSHEANGMVHYVTHFVRCEKCSSQAGFDFGTKEAAARAWNTRAPSDEKALEVIEKFQE